MKTWVVAVCVLAASAANAGSSDDFVAADGKARTVSVFLVRPAELVAIPVTVSSDASKPEERQAAVRLGQAQLTAQARAKELLAVEGPVRLVARRDSKLSSSYETRPSADVTLLQRVGGELGAANVFAAAAQIENLVGGQKPPEDASFRLGDGQLVVSDPEQFRPELLRAIARDVAKTREGLGPTARVSVSGLEGPVIVRARNTREVELFIEYALAIELK